MAAVGAGVVYTVVVEEGVASALWRALGRGRGRAGGASPRKAPSRLAGAVDVRERALGDLLI
jgi:hypothetical protein